MTLGDLLKNQLVSMRGRTSEQGEVWEHWVTVNSAADCRVGCGTENP